MKKIIVVAAVAALAACSQAEKAPEAEPTEEVAEAAPANIAADGLPTVGMYKITNADGTTFTSDVRADGTWVDTAADGTQTTGRWEQPSPDRYCSTPDEEGAVQKCYEEYIDENGVYISKDPETGETSKVERVES
ncbi:MAG: hypothetical protein APF78_09515 [Sphingomonadales bacterium BRH_c3]|nr:MAG: hypothetical protein APF78_09515 [Sphingomonadales bacterium BRH_c3]